MVFCSTQRGSYEAMQRFPPDMPCVPKTLSHHCCAHNTDHVCFVFYTDILGFQISFPLMRPKQGIGQTMCRAVYAWQSVAIHEWMDAGYSSKSQIGERRLRKLWGGLERGGGSGNPPPPW